MFKSKNKKNKNSVYTCIPQFYNIKVGLKGVSITWMCYPNATINTLP